MKYPIVLIHGFPLDSAIWDAQAKSLRARGYTVLTPDLPGFGQAPAICGATIESFTDVIVGLITNAGGKAVVGGFSMGGYVTLSLLRAHPEMVAGGMLINTRANADSPEALAGRLASIEQMRQHGPGQLFDTMLEKLLSKRAGPKLKAAARAIMERQHVEGLIAAQQAMGQRQDQTDLLSQLTLPLLMLVGAEDVISPPSVAMAMHNLAPHSMLVQIAKAGHLSPMEEPERVTGAIETFLATVK